MKVNLHLVEAIMVSLLLMGGSLWPVTSQISRQIPPGPTTLPDQSAQTLMYHPASTNLAFSPIFTYYTYLPIINKTFFDLVSFPVMGPGFAVPAIDNRYIYVGSGFGSYCENIGEIRAIDKETLTPVWKSNAGGSVGDTTLTLANNQVIFGAGDGITSLNTSDGRLIWRLHLNGCFKESFIRLYRGRIYLGSSTGYIYSITTQGQLIWKKRLTGAVFAAPAVVGDTLYFVDMTNMLTAIKLATGQTSWQKKLPLEPGDRAGIFASPLFYDNSLFIATYSNDIWRVSLTGKIEAQYSSKDRYIASPIVCAGNVIAANLSGQVDWLDVTNLHLNYTTNTTEPYLFGTPQCVNNVIIVTGYGIQNTPSALYYLQQGQVLKRFEFVCCKAALTTTMIDGSSVYNVLTTFNLHEEVELARSLLAINPLSISEEYLLISRLKEQVNGYQE